jgi:hypothetical protein
MDDNDKKTLLEIGTVASRWKGLTVDQLIKKDSVRVTNGRVTYLFLSDNGLTTLPAGISQLNSLTYLNLRYNGLTTLPAGISKLNSLTWLDLRNNPITSGLENLRHLTKLDTLYLTPDDLLASSLNLPAALRDKPLQDKLSFLREKYDRASRRCCVLACLSTLTAKLNAGEEYAAPDEGEGEVGGGGGQGDGGGLQGVLAFEIIASADVWRYILEFV